MPMIQYVPVPRLSVNVYLFFALHTHTTAKLCGCLVSQEPTSSTVFATALFHVLITFFLHESF